MLTSNQPIVVDLGDGRVLEFASFEGFGIQMTQGGECQVHLKLGVSDTTRLMAVAETLRVHTLECQHSNVTFEVPGRVDNPPAQVIGG